MRFWLFIVNEETNEYIFFENICGCEYYLSRYDFLLFIWYCKQVINTTLEEFNNMLCDTLNKKYCQETLDKLRKCLSKTNDEWFDNEVYDIIYKTQKMSD